MVPNISRETGTTSAITADTNTQSLAQATTRRACNVTGARLLVTCAATLLRTKGENMSCFHPIKCWRVQDETKLCFADNPKIRGKFTEQLRVPCGKCIGCMLDRANEWATRCYCETKEWKENCFITLTYNDENLPKNKQLCKKDLQDFWKRLRYYFEGKETWVNPQNGKIENPIRYFVCGEYGPKTHRPHYHACVFNWKPSDLKFYKENHNKDRLFTSETLNKIWGKGFVIVGELTYESACYVARYVSKKIFKKSADYDTAKIQKEFTLCSTNGGIGIKYWKEHKVKITENEGILIKIKGKVKCKKIPKYFMRKWKETGDPEYDMYTYEMQQKGIIAWGEILSRTDKTESEYLEMLEINLLKKQHILRRDNII